MYFALTVHFALIDQPEVDMSKDNRHKKMTFEDKFDRKWACWVQNNRKAWHWWKHKTRRDFRRKMRSQTRKEFVDESV